MAKHQTFRKLINHDKDFVGMIAYTVYKNEKIDWIDRFIAKEQRSPTQAEIDIGFNIATDSDLRIENYRSIAEVQLNSFIDLTIANEIEGYRQEIHDDAIVKSIKKLETKSWKDHWDSIWTSLVSTAIIAFIGIVIWLWQMKNNPKFLQLMLDTAKASAS